MKEKEKWNVQRLVQRNKNISALDFAICFTTDDDDSLRHGKRDERGEEVGIGKLFHLIWNLLSSIFLSLASEPIVIEVLI